MKRIASLSLLFVLSASGAALAQSEGMKDMDMDNCMQMQGMKDMDMKKCREMMNGMKKDEKAQGKNEKAIVHETVATVKNVNAAKGKVTLAHEPVASLKWPAMTMGFSVKDKTLFDKLAVGKKVEVRFVQQGSRYVVIAVK